MDSSSLDAVLALAAVAAAAQQQQEVEEMGEESTSHAAPSSSPPNGCAFPPPPSGANKRKRQPRKRIILDDEPGSSSFAPSSPCSASVAAAPSVSTSPSPPCHSPSPLADSSTSLAVQAADPALGMTTPPASSARKNGRSTSSLKKEVAAGGELLLRLQEIFANSPIQSALQNVLLMQGNGDSSGDPSFPFSSSSFLSNGIDPMVDGRGVQKQEAMATPSFDESAIHPMLQAFAAVNGYSFPPSTTVSFQHQAAPPVPTLTQPQPLLHRTNLSRTSSAGASTPSETDAMVKDDAVEKQQDARAASTTLLKRKLFDNSREIMKTATSFMTKEERIDLDDLENFAQHFKKQRIKFGFTQGDVGQALGRRYGTDFSQTTISRFEALNLSFKNMCKLRPLLKEWLADAENALANGATLADLLERPAQKQPPCVESPECPTGQLKKRRKRTNLDAAQKAQLDREFAVNPRPDHTRMASISEQLELDKDVVRVWFCNRRQKMRKSDDDVVFGGGNSALFESGEGSEPVPKTLASALNEDQSCQKSTSSSPSAMSQHTLLNHRFSSNQCKPGLSVMGISAPLFTAIPPGIAGPLTASLSLDPSSEDKNGGALSIS